MQTKAALKLTAILLAFTAISGYSFQPDDLTPGMNQAQPALAAAPQVQQPTAQQLEAAQTLTDIDVTWDPKTGTPLSIRGEAITSRNLGGKGLNVTGKGDYARNAIAVLDSLTTVYRIKDASSEFLVEKVESDNLGFHHARVAQVYQGLRVVGGALIVHFNSADQAYQVNGNYVPDLAIQTDPKLGKTETVHAAQLDLAAMGKPQGELKKEPELVIYARNASPVLAYELVLTYSTAAAGAGSWHYWIDANTGAIVNRYNEIPKTVIQGNILEGEGGQSVKVEGSFQSPTYYLLTTAYMTILNADNTGAYPDSGYPASRTSPDWGASDRTEMSAAYNFYLALAYYYTVHKRYSYDNAGAQAKAYVHVPGGTDNGYWSPNDQAFFFYPASTLSELTVLDFVGHEFTHAVTEKTANLVYQNESGALNESFSDIFAACIEFACQPDGRSLYPNKQAGHADWLFAEDCCIYTAFNCARDMRNPSSQYTMGYAQGNPQPSQYKGSYWYSGSQDNGGVHVNSGVQNYFFYLLCEGGSGFSGIGVTEARQLAYRTLTVYCSQNTDYNAVRTAWISAAQDLNAAWVDIVKAAWSAVGVGGGGGNYDALALQYYNAGLEYYYYYAYTGQLIYMAYACNYWSYAYAYYYLGHGPANYAYAYYYYYQAYAYYYYFTYYGDSSSAAAYFEYYYNIALSYL